MGGLVIHPRLFTAEQNRLQWKQRTNVGKGAVPGHEEVSGRYVHIVSDRVRKITHIVRTITHIPGHARTFAQSHVHVRRLTHILGYVPTLTHITGHVHTFTSIPGLVRTLAHISEHVRILAFSHRHTYVHSHIFSDTCVYLHTLWLKHRITPELLAHNVKKKRVFVPLVTHSHNFYSL